MRHHSGLLRRPDSSVWWVSFYANGRRYRLPTCVPVDAQGSRAAARRVADELRKKAVLGEYDRPGSRPFDIVAAEYLHKMEQQQHGTHLANTRLHVRFWSQAFGQTPCTAITRRNIEEAREALLDGLSDRTGRRRSAASINRYLQTLRHLMSYAVQWQEITHNPAAGRGLKLQEPPPRERILTEDETYRLLEHCRPPLRQLVIIALSTAARLKEIACARWSANVDLRERLVTIHATETKTRRGRLVPLNSTALQALMTLPDKNDGQVIMPCSANSLTRQFKQALQEAGISGATFHTIRHTVISRLHAAGVPVGAVAALVGHSVAGTTLRTYTHVQRAELERVVEVLELDARRLGFGSVSGTFSDTVASKS